MSATSLFSLGGVNPHERLGLIFQWTADRNALQGIVANRLGHRFRDFDYSVHVVNGFASKTSKAWALSIAGQVRFAN
jgi:hypothetical protein